MVWVFLTALIVGGLGFAGWVRGAPSDPARWHVSPPVARDTDRPGGVIRVVAGDMAALDEIIRAEPRTKVLAGSVAEGRLTYITRSALWGFPDYCTVEQQGGNLVVWSRLRFGRSDMGVNRARVTRWLDRLAQG
mgnify:CR=1 FL=1